MKLVPSKNVPRLYCLWRSSDGVCVGKARLSTSGYIWGVEVFPQFRRRGYGLRLMREMIELAGKEGHPWVRLRVHADNTPARTLYDALEFREVVRDSDSHGVWLEMELEIDSRDEVTES